MKNDARLQIRCESDWYFRLCQEAQRSNLSLTEYVKTCIALGQEAYHRQKVIEEGRRS